jgi:hypothetical protein
MIYIVYLSGNGFSQEQELPLTFCSYQLVKKFSSGMEPKGLASSLLKFTFGASLNHFCVGHNFTTHWSIFNVFLSISRCIRWSVSLMFSINFVCISCFPVCPLCPAHVFLPDFITITILCEKCKLWSSTFCHFGHFFVTSSFFRPKYSPWVSHFQTFLVFISC